MEKISIIIPINDEKIVKFKDKLDLVSSELNKIKFEYIFIYKNNNDVKEISIEDKKVKYISLINEFNINDYIYEGLKYASGDYALIIESDDDIKYITKMYELIKDNDVVSINYNSKINKLYKYVLKIENISNYKMMKRNVYKSIVRYGIYNCFITDYLGYSNKWIDTKNEKKINISYKDIISTTNKPLLMLSNTSIIVIILELLLVILSIILKLKDLLIISLVLLNIRELLIISIVLKYKAIKNNKVIYLIKDSNIMIEEENKYL